MNEIDASNPILSKPIEEIFCDHECVTLTARSLNAFRVENMHYVKDLIVKEKNFLKKLPNVGAQSLAHIQDVLAKNFLSLGMRIIEPDKAQVTKKTPCKRELLFDDGFTEICRYPVFGGWMLYHEKYYAEGTVITPAFVHDPNHEWEIE